MATTFLILGLTTLLVGLFTFTKVIFIQTKMMLVGENLAISTAQEYYYNGNESACSKAAEIIASYGEYKLLSCELKEHQVQVSISTNAIVGFWELRKSYRACPLFTQINNRDIIPSL